MIRLKMQVFLDNSHAVGSLKKDLTEQGKLVKGTFYGSCALHFQVFVYLQFSLSAVGMTRDTKDYCRYRDDCK